MFKFKTIFFIVVFAHIALLAKSDTLDYDEFQYIVKTLNGSLPIDMSNDFHANYQSDLNADMTWESFFLNGYELNLVYRYGFPKSNIKTNFINELKPYFIKQFKTSVIISEAWEDMISTLCYQGGNMKITLLFSDNTSINLLISKEELEDIDDFILSGKNEVLDFVYNNYFKDANYPQYLSDDEKVMLISYNEDFWIEYREISLDLFKILDNNEKRADLHDRLLNGFKISNLAIALIFISTDLDFKFVFSNPENKNTFEILLTREEIFKSSGFIWRERIEAIGQSLSK